MRKKGKGSRSKVQRKGRGQNNLLFFKIIDPVIQSGMFVYILYYGLDPGSQYAFDRYLIMLPAFQVLSAIINLFVKDQNLFQWQRSVLLVLIVSYIVFFETTIRKVKEVYIALDVTDPPTIPMYMTIFSAIAFVISFLYTFLCYREIKGLLESVNKGNTGN